MQLNPISCQFKTERKNGCFCHQKFSWHGLFALVLDFDISLGSRMKDVCFEGYFKGEKFNWSLDLSLGYYCLDSIFVREKQKEIGYIQRISITCDRKTATIGHFATELHNKRQGLGTYIAKSFAAEVKKRFGVEAIIFRQTTNYDFGYEQFFRSIGAIPVENYELGVCEWHWEI